MQTCFRPFRLLSRITRMGALKQQVFVSHSSGGWKCKIKAPADLMSAEAPLPGVQMSILFCPRGVEHRGGSKLSCLILQEHLRDSTHMSIEPDQGNSAYETFNACCLI